MCVVCDCETLGPLHNDQLVVSLSVPSPKSLVMHEVWSGVLVQMIKLADVLFVAV